MGALVFINCIIYELWISIRIVQHHLNKTTMVISSIFAYLDHRSRQLFICCQQPIWRVKNYSHSNLVLLKDSGKRVSLYDPW